MFSDYLKYRLPKPTNYSSIFLIFYTLDKTERGLCFIRDSTSLQNDNKLSNQNVQKSVKNSASYSSINIIHIASGNPIY